jgi:hypothetical protein
MFFDLICPVLPTLFEGDCPGLFFAKKLYSQRNRVFTALHEPLRVLWGCKYEIKIAQSVKY